MKKIVSTVLVCVLLLGCVLSLASCDNMLTGTYEMEATEGNKTTYKFTPFKVTRTVTILGESETTEGKYKITENDEGEFEITFTWEGEEPSKPVSFSKGEEDGVKYIRLAGLFTFKKVKK